MAENEFIAGDIVRHTLFTQSSHMMVIHKLGENTYGCRYYQGGQFLYSEFEAFELERISLSNPLNPGDMISAS